MCSDSEAISELTANHHTSILLILESLHACGVLNRLAGTIYVEGVPGVKVTTSGFNSRAGFE